MSEARSCPKFRLSSYTQAGSATSVLPSGLSPSPFLLNAYWTSISRGALPSTATDGRGSWGKLCGCARYNASVTVVFPALFDPMSSEKRPGNWHTTSPAAADLNPRTATWRRYTWTP